MIERLDVVFTEQADADLASIYEWIADDTGNRTVAFRYVMRLTERCERIGDAPRAGRARDELRQGLRSVSFEGKALILYLIEDQRVLVTNVVHRGRDLVSLFE